MKKYTVCILIILSLCVLLGSCKAESSVLGQYLSASGGKITVNEDLIELDNIDLYQSNKKVYKITGDKKFLWEDYVRGGAKYESRNNRLIINSTIIVDAGDVSHIYVVGLEFFIKNKQNMIVFNGQNYYKI